MDNVCNTNKVQNLNEFVKNCITQAFVQLLREKDFGKISVTEICSKAGVARVSFYRNFESKEDILSKHIEKIFFDVQLNENVPQSRKKIENICRRSFDLALENREFFSTLNRNGLLYMLFDQLKFFTPVHIADAGKYTHEIQPSFFAGASYGVISYWIESGFKTPVDKLTQEFVDILYIFISTDK